MYLSKISNIKDRDQNSSTEKQNDGTEDTLTKLIKIF